MSSRSLRVPRALLAGTIKISAPSNAAIYGEGVCHTSLHTSMHIRPRRVSKACRLNPGV